MSQTLLARPLAELPASIDGDAGFFLDLDFDSQPLLTYATKRELCLDLLVEGTWYPLFRTERTKSNWHFSQILPDGKLLLVRSRSRGVNDPNATILDSGGVQSERLYLGDAIEHCQVDALGNIWVGYFDEAFGTQEPSRHGLVKFSGDGQALFEFSKDAAYLPSIVDCYALNVSGRAEAWLCYFTAFPLVQISGKEVTLVLEEAPVRGSKDLLVHRKRNLCAFWGDYNQSSCLSVIDLDTGAVEVLPLTSEDGGKLDGASTRSRGSRLVLQLGSWLYEFDLNLHL